VTTRTFSGVLAIVLPLAFNATFFALGSAFEYPDILRQPTADILEKFSGGGPGLVRLWYLFATTALLAIPLAVLLGNLFAPMQPALARASTVAGVLSGLVQTLGLLRWVFLVPGLAAVAADAAADPATRSAAIVVFEAAHRYLGVGVGEHLGYLFTGAWTLLLSAITVREGLGRPWLGALGTVAALGIMIGMLEPAGWEPAGLVVALSYILWSLWLIAFGVLLLRGWTSRTP
jgi:hypothetical protein